MDVESTIGATVSVDHGNGVFTNCESIQIGCLQSDDGAAGLDLIVSLVNILTINLDTNELAEQAVNNEGDVMVAVLRPGAAVALYDVVGHKSGHQLIQICLGSFINKRLLVVGECVIGIVRRLDSRFIILLYGVGQFVDEFFNFRYILISKIQS